MPHEFERVAAESPCNPARMLNIPFYFLFSLLTDDDFPPKTMEFRHFAMGKVRSALKSLSRRCSRPVPLRPCEGRTERASTQTNRVGLPSQRAHLPLAACCVPQIVDHLKILGKLFRKDALFVADTPRQCAEYFAMIMHDPAWDKKELWLPRRKRSPVVRRFTGPIP